MGILEDWNITLDDLNAVLSDRPSVRGILIGFLSEYKLQRGVFSDARIHHLVRYDDHDRTRPADFSFNYQGRTATVEVKSLQTNSVRNLNGGFDGRCQVDASDKRPVTFPDGSTLSTTCLLAGRFDFLQRWEFAFIHNADLPRSRHRPYTEYQREHLLATNVQSALATSTPVLRVAVPNLGCNEEASWQGVRKREGDL